MINPRQSLQLPLALGAIVLQMFAAFAQISPGIACCYGAGALCADDRIGCAGEAVEAGYGIVVDFVLVAVVAEGRLFGALVAEVAGVFTIHIQYSFHYNFLIICLEFNRQ